MNDSLFKELKPQILSLYEIHKESMFVVVQQTIGFKIFINPVVYENTDDVKSKLMNTINSGLIEKVLVEFKDYKMTPKLILFVDGYDFDKGFHWIPL